LLAMPQLARGRPERPGQRGVCRRVNRHPLS